MSGNLEFGYNTNILLVHSYDGSRRYFETQSDNRWDMRVGPSGVSWLVEDPPAAFLHGFGRMLELPMQGPTFVIRALRLLASMDYRDFGRTTGNEGGATVPRFWACFGVPICCLARGPRKRLDERRTVGAGDLCEGRHDWTNGNLGGPRGTRVKRPSLAYRACFGVPICCFARGPRKRLDERRAVSADDRCEGWCDWTNGNLGGTRGTRVERLSLAYRACFGVPICCFARGPRKRLDEQRAVSADTRIAQIPNVGSCLGSLAFAQTHASMPQTYGMLRWK